MCGRLEFTKELHVEGHYMLSSHLMFGGVSISPHDRCISH